MYGDSPVTMLGDSPMHMGMGDRVLVRFWHVMARSNRVDYAIISTSTRGVVEELFLGRTVWAGSGVMFGLKAQVERSRDLGEISEGRQR